MRFSRQGQIHGAHPTRLTQYTVVGENMDIMSIRGAEHVLIAREVAEEVARPTVWKEVVCGSGELMESGWYKPCTSLSGEVFLRSRFGIGIGL